MAITQTPQKPFDLVIIDTVGPYDITDSGNRFAVTLIDDLSKYLIMIPIPNKEAKTIARAILENCILVFGNIKSLRSDRGSELKNEIVNYAKCWKQNMTFPQHFITKRWAPLKEAIAIQIGTFISKLGHSYEIFCILL